MCCTTQASTARLVQEAVQVEVLVVLVEALVLVLAQVVMAVVLVPQRMRVVSPKMNVRVASKSQEPRPLGVLVVVLVVVAAVVNAPAARLLLWLQRRWARRLELLQRQRQSWRMVRESCCTVVWLPSAQP